MTTTPLSLSHTRRPDGTPVLSVVGEVDLSNSGELAAALEYGLDPVAGPLTIDLSHVWYLDSAGLSVLFAHAAEIEVVVAPLLAPVLAVSGLDEVAPVHAVTLPPERR